MYSNSLRVETVARTKVNSRQGTAHCEQGTTFWRILIATPYMLRDETKKKRSSGVLGRPREKGERLFLFCVRSLALRLRPKDGVHGRKQRAPQHAIVEWSAGRRASEKHLEVGG